MNIGVFRQNKDCFYQSVVGKKYGQCERQYIGCCYDKQRNQQVPFLIRASIPSILIFQKDFSVALFDNKNIVKYQCGNQINGGRK
jgi:hypothetical protein